MIPAAAIRRSTTGFRSRTTSASPRSRMRGGMRRVFAAGTRAGYTLVRRTARCDLWRERRFGFVSYELHAQRWRISSGQLLIWRSTGEADSADCDPGLEYGISGQHPIHLLADAKKMLRSCPPAFGDCCGIRSAGLWQRFGERDRHSHAQRTAACRRAGRSCVHLFYTRRRRTAGDQYTRQFRPLRADDGRCRRDSARQICGNDFRDQDAAIQYAGRTCGRATHNAEQICQSQGIRSGGRYPAG